MSRSKSTTKKPTAAEKRRRAAQAAAAKSEGEQTQVANGVILTREADDEGNIKIESAPLGDVKITEVPTLLAIAKKQLEQRLGIAE